MLTKLRTLASLYLELGPRWSTFRLAYAFRLRTGLIRLQTPQYAWADRPLNHWLHPSIPSDPDSYATWRKQNAPKFFAPVASVGAGSPRPDYGTNAIEEADKLLNGELKFFSHTYHQTGFLPNWHKDPITNYQLPTNSHWSQISDDSTADIKFTWEPNRFAFVYTLVRAYAATGDEKYPQAFWRLIQDWADHNPPNTGANWKDGQEIALRLMAWTFGFYQFSNSPFSTSQRIAQFTQLLAAQAERIYANIGYAISTRSNHTISEAFGLWMVGLLFPELKDAKKYLALGKRLLEEEAAKQIFPDGSYAMYSLNYHRVILHLCLYAIRLAELNNIQFSNSLYSSISSSIQYLSHLIDPTTGQMPVYGSNDSALVLPLNNCDFTDYRPLLQLGSVITTGQPIFEPGDWDEDVFWLCGNDEITKKEERRKNNIGDSFPNGGVYILRSSNSHAFIRCTDFTSRPSHADQLHMDLWMGSHNIAVDAGTYLYSGEGIWRNGLARTSAHNTVTVDGKDQMTLVSRFTWTNWAKGRAFKHTDNLWQGEHDGYKPVRHKRTVMALEGDRWLVIDDLDAKGPHHYTLHWLLNDVPFTQNKNSLHLKYEASIYKIQTGLLKGEGKFTTLRADPDSTYGWRSRYYGHKEPAISLLLEADQPSVRFWTFFGFRNDVCEISGNEILINSKPVSIGE
ncbi:MAG: hypothetical protein JETCAE01_09750 [Anaerolineaceae bacterium]|nr:MAG: hypothetical protein JETCAE01_09750 [Anaerolineaceae bacterium]